jgi:amidase
MLAFMSDFDLIVCPAAAHAAPPPILEWREEHAMPPTIGLYTVPYNLTGWPVVVLRTGTTDTGLPVGVQLVARPWREDVALAAAQHLEAALGGWQPPGSAAS